MATLPAKTVWGNATKRRFSRGNRMSFKEPFPRTLRAQWLGQQMRDLRTRRGMTLQGTAHYFGRDHSTLARLEKAEWPFKRADVVALLDIYGVYDGQERARLLQLCDDCWRTDEWDVDFADAGYDRRFVDCRWLEARARVIGVYQPFLVPDLLRTPAYAEAVVRLAEGPRGPADVVNQAVDQLAERQQVLESGRTKLSAILDESVLRRQLGDAESMRTQLGHLADLARRPHVEIRLLPAAVNLYPRFAGPFVLYRMPHPYPEVAYLENLAGRIYLETPRSKRFVVAYDRLRAAALSSAESARLLADACGQSRYGKGEAATTAP
jgi:transcriptional regulator with XRE-family HTH domain